ncbi:hypothetical protein [Amycolatopsis sp. MEPSY49]|uniref:hypothetical protein n=1 Tax=Amycolatopsis sp. MEPSY49 TaxID=3151600 RepID=UPI003EF93FA5
MRGDDVEHVVGEFGEVQGLLVGEEPAWRTAVEHLLQLGVRDRRDQLEERGQPVPDPRDELGVPLRAVEPGDDQRHPGRAVVRHRHEGHRRSVQAGEHRPGAVGQRGQDVAREPQSVTECGGRRRGLRGGTGRAKRAKARRGTPGLRVIAG